MFRDNLRSPVPAGGVPTGPAGMAKLGLSCRAALGPILALTALAGCALTPYGTRAESDRVAAAGGPYDKAPEKRDVPELPDSPTWSDVLRRAFLVNGDLEASYFDWQAAFDRVEIASAYPNSRLMVGFSYMFSGGNMKAFDRSTFSFSPDSMQSLMLPNKVKQQGRVALDGARAAGARFRGAKFELQKRVLSAWADYCLAAERTRIEQERRDLASLALEASKSRVNAGGLQQDLLRAQVALESSDDALRRSRAELEGQRAMLNGLLAREPDAPLRAPAAMPPPRPIAADDATLLNAAVEQNPELEALARSVEGRSDALELARLQWLPDINPTFSFTGTISQAIGAGVMLPTTIRQIQGQIKEAGAMFRGAQASLRQASHDRAGSFVATLVALRDAERQVNVFETRIIPPSEQLVSLTSQTYAAGAAGYLDMIEAQRTLLDARLVLAEAKASREKRLAELETLMGTDIETFAATTTHNQPETRVPGGPEAGPIAKETHHE